MAQDHWILSYLPRDTGGRRGLPMNAGNIRGPMMVRLKPCQSRVFLSPHRFRILVAGRRFGKTYLAQIELLQAAWAKRGVAWYVAPTYQQAKRIAWNPLKELTRPYWSGRPNETDLRIELQNGST